MMNYYLFGYLDALAAVVITIAFLIFSWKRVFTEDERQKIIKIFNQHK